MQYKNNKSMVAQELGRIAGVQHHTAGYRNTVKSEGRSVFDTPLSFKRWFSGCLRHYQAKGYRLTWQDLTTILVVFPDGTRGSRTIASFEAEYNEDYKTQFPNCA